MNVDRNLVDLLSELRPWVKHSAYGMTTDGCFLVPSVDPDSPNCTCGLREAWDRLSSPASESAEPTRCVHDLCLQCGQRQEIIAACPSCGTTR